MTFPRLLTVLLATLHVATLFPSLARGAARPAARATAFRLEHALTLRSISDLTWSADGRRLAFVVTEVDTAENANNQDLWLADLERDETLRLTRHPKADFSPTFSPSGDTLAFVAGRGTGDDAKPGIYMMSMRGGEPWVFGSFDESIAEVRWSPDGRSLAYVKLDTLPRSAREWRKKKWDHVVEDERLQYPQLWVMDIASGAKRRLTSGTQHVWYLRWSPDSREIAFLSSPTGKPDDGNRADIGIVAATGGPQRVCGVIGTPFEWSPDGRWIACATHADRGLYVAKEDVWLIPARGGAPIDLTGAFDEDGKTPAWNATSDTLFFHSDQGVTSVVAAVPLSLDARGTGDTDPRQARHPRHPGRRMSTESVAPSRIRLPVELPVRPSIDRDAEAGAMVAARDGRVAWVQSSPKRPSEVWVADHPSLPGRTITSFHDHVASLAYGETRRMFWRSSDGSMIGGLLVRPPGVPANRPLPTLVQLHGGPYASRNALAFLPLPRYFAAHGFQVFLPNFHSSGGYGTAFMLRERADWGGQDWHDVASGVDSLVRWGLADPARLGVYGRSYGGYLTAWAITQTDRFDAACVFAGAVDLPSLYGQSDVQKYRAFEFEGAPWKTPGEWAESSPMTHITRAKTPTLIQVGENDARVPYPQGQQLYRALLGLGVPCEFTHYPREGHVLREPRHRADHMTRMLGWWKKWVK